MMLYIDRLPKAERKAIKEQFLKTNEPTDDNVSFKLKGTITVSANNSQNGSSIYLKAHRIFILSIIGVGLGLASIIFDILYQNDLWSYILDSLLILFSLVFMFRTRTIKLRELNKYALAQKKK